MTIPSVLILFSLIIFAAISKFSLRSSDMPQKLLASRGVGEMVHLTLLPAFDADGDLLGDLEIVYRN